MNLKTLGIGIGIALDLVGVVWILQGVGLLPGSFMTGDIFWAWVGFVSIIAGTALAIVSARRTPPG